MGCALGVPDDEGFIEMVKLGLDDGCNVGEGDADGFSLSCVLGFEEVDGYCDGGDVGSFVTVGKWLGSFEGLFVGSSFGAAEGDFVGRVLGDVDGPEVGETASLASALGDFV